MTVPEQIREIAAKHAGTGPSAQTLEVIENLIHGVISIYGSTLDGEHVVTVPTLHSAIQALVAGVLSKDIPQEFHTANVLIWYLSKALQGLRIQVTPAGVERLHERLGALLHGDGAPMRAT